MAEGRSAKIRRLLGGTRNVSHVAALLRRLREATEEDREVMLGCSRWSMKRANEALWAQVRVEETLDSATGTPIQWECVSLSKLIDVGIRTAPGIASLFEALWRLRPCTRDTPYTLLLYGDEVVPGDALKLDNHRKAFVMYVAVREWGPFVLKHVEAWRPLCLIRSTLAGTVAGGLANAVRICLRRMFVHEGISTTGVVVPMRNSAGGQAILFFKLRNLVLDGDAMRFTFSCMGAAGKLPCLGCLNVMQRHDDTPLPAGFVDMSSGDYTRFQHATNEDVWTKAETLRAQFTILNRTNFRALETATGLRYNPLGALYGPELREHVKPIDVLTHDAMHVLFANGLGQLEFSLILQRLEAAGYRWEDIRDWMSSHWRSCRAFGPMARLRDCWNDARAKAFHKTQAYKASASEMLMLFPIFGYYLATEVAPRGHLAQEIRSYDALELLVGLVKNGKFGRHADTASVDLSNVAKAHQDAFVEAYPDARVPPKGHWQFHLGPQLQRDGMTIDCFVGERQNKLVKSCAQTIANTSSFEVSVMERLVADRFSVLSDARFFEDTLYKPEPLEVGSPTLVALSMKFRGTLIYQDDILFIDDVPHYVHGCGYVDGEFAWFSSRCACVSQLTPAASRLDVAPDMDVLRLRGRDVRLAAAFFWESDTRLVALAW